jgi:hypothetical protein
VCLSALQPEPPPPPPPPPEEPPPLLPAELESWLEPELLPLVPGGVEAAAILSDRFLLMNPARTAGLPCHRPSSTAANRRT